MNHTSGLGRRLERLEAKQARHDPFAAIARALLTEWDDFGRRCQNTYGALCRSRVAGEDLSPLDRQFLAAMDRVVRNGDVMAPIRETLEFFAATA